MLMSILLGFLLNLIWLRRKSEASLIFLFLSSYPLHHPLSLLEFVQDPFYYFIAKQKKTRCMCLQKVLGVRLRCKDVERNEGAGRTVASQSGVLFPAVWTFQALPF